MLVRFPLGCEVIGLNLSKIQQSFEAKICKVRSFCMELVTILRSNLFDYITPELGLELAALMHHLKIEALKI